MDLVRTLLIYLVFTIPQKIFVLHLNEASTEPNTDDNERILQVWVLNIVVWDFVIITSLYVFQICIKLT